MNSAVKEQLNSALYENVRQPISTAELERRWQAARVAMRRAQGPNGYSG